MKNKSRTAFRLKPIHYVLLIAVGFYALYFAGLGASPLLDPDEPIYGQFVKEMVASGDWLTPRYSGKLWFDKPPMYYWLASAGVKLFGLSDFTIRLPSAVCAVGIVLMVYFLASYDFGKRAGVFASLVMATTLMQIVMSHAAATDAIMVFFLVAALYAYRRWLDEPGRARLVWMAACGAATGFGTLTKGPVVPVLLFVVFALHLLWVRSLKKLRAPDMAVGIGVALVIGLPWFVAMYMMHGQAFVDGFIIKNNLARFAKPLHKSQTGQWFSYLRNVPIMLAFFLPWSTFLPQAIKGNWRANDGAKLLVTWLAVVFVFFSISKTQNFTYTYPVFPAAAVLVGAMLSRAATGERESVRGVSVGLWVGLGIGLLLAAAMPIFALKKFPEATIPAAVMGASIALPFVISLIRRARITDTAWITSVGMVVFTLALVCTAMPMVAPYKSTKLISQRISSLPTARVVAYKLWRPGLLYYMNRKPMDVDDPAKIHELMSSHAPTLMICSDRDKEQVERDLSNFVFDVGDLEVYANHAYARKNN